MPAPSSRQSARQLSLSLRCHCLSLLQFRLPLFSPLLQAFICRPFALQQLAVVCLYLARQHLAVVCLYLARLHLAVERLDLARHFPPRWLELVQLLYQLLTSARPQPHRLLLSPPRELRLLLSARLALACGKVPKLSSVKSFDFHSKQQDLDSHSNCRLEPFWQALCEMARFHRKSHWLCFQQRLMRSVWHLFTAFSTPLALNRYVDSTWSVSDPSSSETSPGFARIGIWI